MYKVIHVCAVTERQKEGLRFKLDTTSVWFSISTCHRRQGVGLMHPVTPNRWALLLGKPLGKEAAPWWESMCSVNTDTNGSESLINLVAVSFPSADLGKVTGCEAWVARWGGGGALYDIQASGTWCSMNQSCP